LLTPGETSNLGLRSAEPRPLAPGPSHNARHSPRSGVVEHYVWRAVEALDMSRVRRIAADEASGRRGHDYFCESASNLDPTQTVR